MIIKRLPMFHKTKDHTKVWFIFLFIMLVVLIIYTGD
jgi:hypothetical protein